MAKITDEKVENVGEGILQPVLQHRWWFRYQGNNLINSHKMSVQVVRCAIDLKNSTIDIEIEENVRGDVVEAIAQLVHITNFKCNIDALDGQGDYHFSNEFLYVNVVNHLVEYDYSLNGIVIHKLTLSYKHMRILIPEND